MKIDLEVVYNNSDSGETDEQNISLETFDEKIEFLATVCDARPSEQSFEALFRKMYDNPTKDGAEKGVLYDEVWPIMSNWAFDNLGWSNVTVDVVGITVDGEKLRLWPVMFEITQWSLQLNQDGFMYCYA